jgi:hypothetical protein
VRQVDDARSALAFYRTIQPRSSTIDFVQRLISSLGASFEASSAHQFERGLTSQTTADTACANTPTRHAWWTQRGGANGTSGSSAGLDVAGFGSYNGTVTGYYFQRCGPERRGAGR